MADMTQVRAQAAAGAGSAAARADLAAVSADPVGADEDTTTGGDRLGRGMLAVLVGGSALQVVWRLFLSWPLTGPIAHADEDGYLLGARILAGGPGATLPSWSIMRPVGYPLLLTPAYWLADELTQVYQIVHVTNAVLMALVFPLVYLLSRRLFGLHRALAAGVAFVLATLPSMVFFSQFALTDALLPAVVALLLLLVHGMVDGVGGRAAVWSAVGAGAVVAYAANTHVRGMVMLVVVVAVVALGAWRGWLGWPAVAGCAAAVGVVYAGLGWANAWLEDRLFATGAFSANDRVVNRLTTPRGLGRVVCDGAGQIWHLCTSTYGLAAVGLAAALWALYRREWSRSTRVVLGAALAMTVGIALATSAGTPNEGRVNNHVYGRYVAIFAAFWVLVGVVALVQAGRLRGGWRRAGGLVAGGSAMTVLSLGAVLAYAGRRMAKESYVNFDAPELSFLSGDWDALHLYRMTGYAVGLMLLVAVLLAGPLPRWLPRWTPGSARTVLAAATLAMTMVVNLVAMVVITDRISRSWVDAQYHPTLPELVRDAGVRPGDSVMEATSVQWSVNLRHQHEVYWQALARFDQAGQPPGRPEFVVASLGSPTDFDGTRYGYRVVLRYDAGHWAVWRRG